MQVGEFISTFIDDYDDFEFEVSVGYGFEYQVLYSGTRDDIPDNVSALEVESIVPYTHEVLNIRTKFKGSDTVRGVRCF